MTNDHPAADQDTAAAVLEIHLENALTGATYPSVPVYGVNTMKQILEEYAEDIGIRPDKEWLCFRNRRTGLEVSDANTTVQALGLEPGDTLRFILDVRGVP